MGLMAILICDKRMCWSILVCLQIYNSCAYPEFFVRGGPTLTTVFWGGFLLMSGGRNPNTSIRGPSSARQRNAIKNGVSLAC